MDTYILGIDVGTTGIRVMIFNRECDIMASAYSEITQYFPKGGWVEQDALEIYEVVKHMTEEALKNGAIKPEEIAGIGIANQRETTVVWDKRSGEPLSPAIVWQDRRTLPICEKLVEKYGNELTQRTGMTVIPNTAATKIHWLLKHNTRVAQALQEGQLLYGTIETWLVWKFSGGKIHITDYSNNSVTLLQNATTMQYDELVLNELEIPKMILPQIVPSCGIVGETAKSEFFGAEIPIACVIGDQQAAAIGQGCFEKGMAKNTYGTGSFMVLNTGSQYTKPPEGLFSPVLYSDRKNICYAWEGMSDISGAVLQWLRDELGIIRNEREADAMASGIRDSGGVVLVPAFVGLGVPHFDSYARGAVFGLTENTTKAELARAALESMAYQVWEAFCWMEKCSGIRLKQLRVDGGGANSDFLCQFQADILGIPVERPSNTEATCLGAAYLAGIAVGYWSDIEEIKHFRKRDKIFEPKITESERQELCGHWQCAVEKSKGWLEAPSSFVLEYPYEKH